MLDSLSSPPIANLFAAGFAEQNVLAEEAIDLFRIVVSVGDTAKTGVNVQTMIDTLGLPFIRT